MTENMTVCPDCGADFDAVAQFLDEPRQAIRQQCPDCGYETDIAIVNYPGGSYTVIAQALEDDVCAECDADADFRWQRIGYSVEGRCSEHLHGHEATTWESRTEMDA